MEGCRVPGAVGISAGDPVASTATIDNDAPKAVAGQVRERLAGAVRAA